MKGGGGMLGVFGGRGSRRWGFLEGWKVRVGVGSAYDQNSLFTWMKLDSIILYGEKEKRANPVSTNRKKHPVLSSGHMCTHVCHICTVCMVAYEADFKCTKYILIVLLIC